MKGEVLIIMPAYNEAEGIRRVVADTARTIPFADILVVNDGSADGTGELAALAGALVVNLSSNLGIGGAVQTGYRYAADHGYRFAVQMDGDGQHDPADFHVLLQALSESGADMAVGSRFLERHGFQSTFARRMGIKLLGGLLAVLLRRRITDPTSGYRLCGARAIALFAREYPTDYPEVEALVMLNNHGLSFVESPVVMKKRQSGSSSISPIHSVYYMIKVCLAMLITSTKKRSWGIKGEG